MNTNIFFFGVDGGTNGWGSREVGVALVYSYYFALLEDKKSFHCKSTQS